MTDQQPEALRLADALDTTARPGGLAQDAAAELRRLHQHELAHSEWSEKTEWVQQTAQPHELGMHRADAMRQRIDRLHSVNQQLLEALETISGQRPCVDNLMSDKDIARAAIQAAKEQS